LAQPPAREKPAAPVQSQPVHPQSVQPAPIQPKPAQPTPVDIPVSEPASDAADAFDGSLPDFGLADAPEPVKAKAASPSKAPATVSAAAPSAAKTTVTKKPITTSGAANAPMPLATPKKEKKFPHFLHLSISLCTLGAWSLVWVVHYGIYRMRSKKKA